MPEEAFFLSKPKISLPLIIFLSFFFVSCVVCFTLLFITTRKTKQRRPPLTEAQLIYILRLLVPQQCDDLFPTDSSNTETY